MRSLFLLAAALLALPAGAQTTVRTPNTMAPGELVFGRLTFDSPFLDESGQRRYYETYTYDAVPGERVTFTARSLDFAPAVLVADGPNLNPDAPSIEATADGESVRMDFYAPGAGTYTFAVVAADFGATGVFQAQLDASGPMDYAAVYPGGGDPNDRYALLVGVNDYPAIEADLGGTHNDVEKMRGLLVDHFGYAPENVLVLTDADAQRDHVIEAFARHLGQAGPGGSALFYYSGHGTQLPDTFLGFGASDEDDQSDEALVLWGTGGDFGFLVDEEVGALADNLSAGHRLVVLDNCHSGTGSRGPGEEEKLYRIRNLPFEVIARHGADRPRALVTSNDPGPAGHVLLAAARSDQFSIETTGLSEDGASGGVFTYYLTRALRQADPGASLASVMEGVRAQVMETTEALQFEEQMEPQEPQAEGTKVSDPVRAFFLK
jgi:hypothetical protein